MMDDTVNFRLRDVDADHTSMQIAMPLVSAHDGELRCIGTGFSVAPGLAITAAHVVYDWIAYQEQRDGYRCPEASLSAAAFQCFEGMSYRWDVDAMYACRSSDIAFLRFKRPGWWGDGPGQIKPKYLRLKFDPLEPGEEVRVFGFPSSTVKDGVLYVSPSECTAKVRLVDLKTDITIRPLSYIEVEGEILPGMSGGPCFDKDWNVVGVNCKGWDFLDGEPIGHVALLWPAMKIEIDLFKTGAFPAIKLFNEGPARAIGYRRVHVTSKGEAVLAKIELGTLVPFPPPANADHLEHALNFAVSNAKEALAEAYVVLDKILRNGESHNNELHRSLRHYFWELESALGCALRLAALRIGIPAESFTDWDQFVDAWSKKGADAEALDELKVLGFVRHGVNLFELRTYAELCRGGSLQLQVIIKDEHIEEVTLLSCRKGGEDINLPEGLDRYIDTSRHFVKRLLHLSNRLTV